jgi:hypothetical protein
VLLELLSWLEANVLLHVPSAYRRQCIALPGVALQTAGCSVQNKQQLHRAGNATRNHRLLSWSTVTSHKTQTLHSVSYLVGPSRDTICYREAPRGHAVQLHCCLHSHCTISTLLNTAPTAYTATVQSQQCSVLLLLSTQLLYNLNTAQYCS